MNYLKEFPLAFAAIQDAFEHNEIKHGEGLKFRTVGEEATKAEGHIQSHFHYPVNNQDNCLHLTSAACRSLKTLEAFLTNYPKYQEAFKKEPT